MTRSELKDLGIEDKAVIDSIMKLHGDGIEKAKTDFEAIKGQLEEKDKTIGELNEQIKSFDGQGTALKDLQDKVASYEKAEKDRKEAEEAAKIDNELRERFASVTGEQKWKHADIETGRFNAFKSALNDEANKGKGDADIFAAVTAEMDCFVNPQQEKVKMPPSGNGSNADPENMTQAEYNAWRRGSN